MIPPIKAPINPMTMSPSSPKPVPFITWPAAQPAIAPTTSQATMPPGSSTMSAKRLMTLLLFGSRGKLKQLFSNSENRPLHSHHFDQFQSNLVNPAPSQSEEGGIALLTAVP